MFRTDDPSAVSVMPTPEAAGTEGYFTEGSPGVTPATLVRASFLNMLQEELRAVVVAGSATPSKTVNNQVLTAINALIAPTGISQFSSSKASNGYQKLPSGLIVQWGTRSVAANSSAQLFFSIAFPTQALCAMAIADDTNTTNNYRCSVSALTTGSVFVYSTAPATLNFYVFAIGY